MRKLPDFFKNLFSFFLFLQIPNITFAQQDTLVKRQYVDADNAATTVVVKNNTANDLDILSQQFDNASFGDVIFIKTENISPAKPKSERTSFEEVINQTAKPSPKVASQPISKSKPSTGSNAQPTLKSAKKEIKKEPTTTTNRPSRYYHKGRFINPKTKKKKIKKRRRVKKGNRRK